MFMLGRKVCSFFWHSSCSWTSLPRLSSQSHS